jgi:hypothetical protein
VVRRRAHEEEGGGGEEEEEECPAPAALQELPDAEAEDAAGRCGLLGMACVLVVVEPDADFSCLGEGSGVGMGEPTKVGSIGDGGSCGRLAENLFCIGALRWDREELRRW